MSRSLWRPVTGLLFYFLFASLLAGALYYVARDNALPEDLIIDTARYQDEHIESLKEQLVGRINEQPFNIISFALFAMAVAHTLFAPKFTQLSNWIVDKRFRETGVREESFLSEILIFLGEVEVVFGVWVIPLLVAMAFVYNWGTAINYLNNLEYTEAIFVVVIMALASTKPIFQLAENLLRVVSKLGGRTVKSWWITILTFGPLLGSFITEPGAMTICAMLLGKQFFRLKPSPTLAFGTLGLLFVNISVGGVLTSFAAPPVLLVSKAWGWDTPFMAETFGMAAVTGIVISNLLYLSLFWKEFSRLELLRKENKELEERLMEHDQPIPLWITLVHMTFLAWTVIHAHYPVVFLGSFLMFLGFYRATLPFQINLSLKTPILVGFFLAGLIVHGSLQSWWIGPLLTRAGEGILMFVSVGLTAFNDNAEITYLATLTPNLSEAAKYAIVSGAVTGGGLTVIANAPNPAGQALLSKFFPQGISAWRLFLAALTPTAIVATCFWLI